MTCPMCEKDTDKAFRPFCSKRCADLDLAKWFNGSYAVASTDPEDVDNLEEALDDALRNSDEHSKPH